MHYMNKPPESMVGELLRLRARYQDMRDREALICDALGGVTGFSVGSCGGGADINSIIAKITELVVYKDKAEKELAGMYKTVDSAVKIAVSYISKQLNEHQQ